MNENRPALRRGLPHTSLSASQRDLTKFRWGISIKRRQEAAHGLCIIKVSSTTIQRLSCSTVQMGQNSIFRCPVHVATVTQRGPNNTNDRRRKHHQHTVSIGQAQRHTGPNNATVFCAIAPWPQHRQRQRSKHNQRIASTGRGQRHVRPNNINDRCTRHNQHAISIGHTHTLGPIMPAHRIDRPSADARWVHNTSDPCTKHNQHANSLGHALRQIWPNLTHGPCTKHSQHLASQGQASDLCHNQHALSML